MGDNALPALEKLTLDEGAPADHAPVPAPPPSAKELAAKARSEIGADARVKSIAREEIREREHEVKVREAEKQRDAEHLAETYQALATLKVDRCGAVEGTYVWGNATALDKGDAAGPALQRGADGLVRVAGMTEMESLMNYCRGHFSVEQMAGPYPIRIPGTGSEHEGAYTIFNKLYGTKIRMAGKGVYENVFSMFAPVARAIPPGAWTEVGITKANGTTITVLMCIASAIYIAGCYVSDSPLTRLHESGVSLFALALAYPEVDEACKLGRTPEDVAIETVKNHAVQKRGPKVACEMYAKIYNMYNETVYKMHPERTMLKDYMAILKAIRRGDPNDVPKGSGLELPTHENGTGKPITDADVEGELEEDRLANSVAFVVQNVGDDKPAVPEKE